MSLLDPIAFRQRIESLLGRGQSVRLRVQDHNRRLHLQQLRDSQGKKPSGLRLLTPFIPGSDPTEPVASAVAVDNHPLPPTVDNQQNVKVALAYPDRPDHYENGQLKPQINVLAPGFRAFALSETLDQLPASRFTEELRVIGPYGTPTPTQFQAYNSTAAATGVPTEIWKPDLVETKTVYPLALVNGDAAELSLRIGAVSELYKMAKLTYSSSNPSGANAQIYADDPTGVVTGDEIDLYLQITGAITFFAQPQDGDCTFVSLKVWSGSSRNLFQFVAKTSPGADREEALTKANGQQETLWVREFAIGATLQDTIANCLAKLRSAGSSGTCDLQLNQVFIQAGNQIIFASRYSLIVTNDFQSDWLSTDYIAAFSNLVTLAVTSRMVLYPTWWKEGATVKGYARSVVRVGRSLVATRIMDTAFMVPMPTELRFADGSMGMFPYLGWVKSRDKDEDPSEQTPWIVPQSTVPAGTIDQPNTAVNLIAALRQSESWQRYLELVLSGKLFLETPVINDATLGSVTGITIHHPDGVDAASTSASWRLDTLYWFVQATNTLRFSVPGKAPAGRSRHSIMRRDEDLRTLTATAKIRMRCTLDTTPTSPTETLSDLRLRAGFVFHSSTHGRAEAGLEIFWQENEQDYTWDGNSWEPAGTRSTQKKIRPYLMFTDEQVQVAGSPNSSGTEGDARLFFGWAMAGKDWSPDSSSVNLNNASSTPDEATLTLIVRDMGEDQYVSLTLSRAGKKVSSTLACRVTGATPGAFGLVAQPCAPELDTNGNQNPEIQSIDFTGLTLSAPTGRFSAPYTRGNARQLDFRAAKNAFDRIGHSGLERRQLDMDLNLLPGESLIAIDEKAAHSSALLTIVAIPLASQWLEVSVGNHRVYYQFVAENEANLKAYSVKVPASGTWKQRVAVLSDNLYSAMSRDGNLTALAQVSRQALVSTSGEAAALELRALAGGPRGNIRVKHLLASRVTEASTSCIAGRYTDYASDLVPEVAGLSISGDGGSSIETETVKLSNGLVDLGNPRAAYEYFDSLEE